MRKMVRAMVATVAAAVMAPVVAYAEPMVLTATQMESITAAARPPGININVAINNSTVTQINNAIALSIAIGPGASAFSSIAQSNASATAQLVQR
jgi:hypothetical protein